MVFAACLSPFASLKAVLAHQPSPDWKGGVAVATAMEARAGTLQSGENEESDRTRSAGHSLNIQAAPEEKERGKEFSRLQVASLVILLKIR